MTYKYTTTTELPPGRTHICYVGRYHIELDKWLDPVTRQLRQAYVMYETVRMDDVAGRWQPVRRGKFTNEAGARAAATMMMAVRP